MAILVGVTGKGAAVAEYLTVAELRERGWTPSMIRKLLGSSDKSVPNPVFRSAAPVKLYAVERVIQAEGLEAFTVIRETAERRSRAALAAADRRRGETLADAGRIRVTVRAIEWDVLARKAVEHRNLRDEVRGRHRFDHVSEPARIEEVDETTLHRWMVNYVRHELTSYDEGLVEMFGRVGGWEGTRLLRRRVYEAIAQAYPALAVECHRQLSSREGLTGDRAEGDVGGGGR